MLIAVLGFGMATPLYAVGSTGSTGSPQASSPQVEIINNVSSSASTGGNSAVPAGGRQAGEVIQGESKAQVKIYTEVDGEVVTDINEEVTGPEAKAGKSVEINLPNVKSSVNVVSSVKSEQINSDAVATVATTADVSAENLGESKKANLVMHFLNKILNYVFSLFNV